MVNKCIDILFIDKIFVMKIKYLIVNKIKLCRVKKIKFNILLEL